MRDAILQEIEKLKTKYQTSDPFELIDCLGIQLLVRKDLGKLKGFYYTVCRQRYIVINGDLCSQDQRMVAAHELGHDCLHRDLAKVAPLKDFMLYDMTSQTEYQANIFAAELLIEDQEILSCIADDLDYLSLCAELGYKPELVTFKLFGMVQRGHKLNLPVPPKSTFLQG